jgi:hypothetical protein
MLLHLITKLVDKCIGDSREVNTYLNYANVSFLGLYQYELKNIMNIQIM